MLLGIDVGGTKIASALVTDDGRLAEKRRELLDQSDPDSAVRQLKATIASYASTPVEAVGVCVPGIADRRGGTVWAPNVRGWDHIPLGDTLRCAGGPPIVIESDRNAAVLGETLFGLAKGKRNVVFLILGTGIGAGVLCDGRLLRGAYDIGGAVGWIPVFQDGVARHFEEVAAGPGVERQAREVLQCTDALPALAQSARAGSQPLIDLFARVGERIGEVLSIFVSTFNPEIIVLGGGVSQAWDLFGLTALQAMRRWSQPISVEQVEVAVSQLGEDAGILGAAAAVRWEVGGSGRSL